MKKREKQNIHTCTQTYTHKKFPKQQTKKNMKEEKKSNKSKTKPIKNLVNKEEIMITVVWTQNHRII